MEATDADVPMLATTVLEAIGERLAYSRHLTQGATCDVWQLVSDKRSYALRIFKDQQRVLYGAIDSFIRTEVAKRGGKVVVPVLDSELLNLNLNDKRWTLEPFVNGTHPRRGGLPKETCTTLGETLAALHSIAAEGFGKPSTVSAQVVIADEARVFEGIAQRFENPLPETWRDLYAHPLLTEAPELSEEILARLRDVSEQVRLSRPVVCHSDLHEKQLICRDDHLVALIDFGDASVLDRHWDFGSVLYFHGADNLTNVCEAYVGSCREQISPALVEAFSVAIAMHHASRARLPGKTHRLARAIRFVRDTIQFS